MHAMYSNPVLTVEDGRMGSFLQNELGLASMWRVCSNASDFLENGKRLENLSWRLWNHQTLQLTRSSSSSLSSLKSSLSDASSAVDTPGLSESAESVTSIDSHQLFDDQAVVHPSPAAQRTRKLLLQRQVTPVDLDNLVHTIKEKQNLDGPLSPLPPLMTEAAVPSVPARSDRETPRPSSPRPVSKQDSTTSTATTRTTAGGSLTSAGSGTSGTSIPSSHSVVRGFTPGTGVSSYTSKTQLAPMPAPILKSSAGSRTNMRRKGNMFMLGGSSGEDESSLRDRMSPRSQQTALASSPRSKKQTSFNEEVVEIQAAQENNAPAVFDSDDEDDFEDEDEDDSSEDVMDEDDDEAWEDDVEDDKASKQMDFKRIDSTANLTSRRSQLTLALERSASQANLHSNWSTPTLRRSRTSTPNGPSIPASPDEDGGSPLQMRVTSRPKPIQTTTNQPEVPIRVIPMSPRTTRQKMLAGEMTESFRKQMLWERKQRNVYSTHSSATAKGNNNSSSQANSNNNNHMRRAHTSNDIPNMARDSSKDADAAPLKEQNLSLGKSATGVKGVHWNHYFDNESMAGYHQKGW